MIIAIDESGNFSDSREGDSWSVLVAYCFTERQKSKIYKVLADMKKSAGYSVNNEIKLNDINEDIYFDFIKALGKLDGVVYALATDTSFRSDEYSIKLQEKLTSIFIRASENMKEKGDKDTYLNWSNKINTLSPQLFFQFLCMRDLIKAINSNFLTYFGTIDPKSLNRFRWIIDPKDIKITKYEELIDKVIPIMIDKEPTNNDCRPMILETDDGYLDKYIVQYDENETSSSTQSNNEALNLQTFFRNNLRFPDSKSSKPIQIADLISAGLRRLLKSGFNDNDTASKLLGSIILKPNNSPNAILNVAIHESPESLRLNRTTSQIIQKINRYAIKLYCKSDQHSI